MYLLGCSSCLLNSCTACSEGLWLCVHTHPHSYCVYVNNVEKPTSGGSCSLLLKLLALNAGNIVYTVPVHAQGPLSRDQIPCTYAVYHVSYLDHISRNVTVAFLDAARNVQRLISWDGLTAFPVK